MLVDINLLPKKDPRNLATYLIILLTFVLVLSGVIYFYWQITSTKQEIANLDNEINVTTEILTLEQKKLSDIEALNEVEQLEKAVEWTEKQETDYNFIIKELTKLLPERGYVQNFNLSAENLSMTVQFDRSSEAAYYLTLLQKTDWLTDANITGRSSRDIEQVSDDEENSEDDESILPRYIANYTIIVDLSKVREITNPTEEDDGEELEEEEGDQ